MFGLIRAKWFKKGPKCSFFAVYLLRHLNKVTAKIEYFDPFLEPFWTMFDLIRVQMAYVWSYKSQMVQKGSKMLNFCRLFTKAP